jgi:tetratricopeptide (TPR) repeat protein
MKKLILINLLNILIVLSLFLPSVSLGAEKKPVKKPPAPAITSESSAITDANIAAYLKTADDLLKKGSLDSSLRIYLRVYNYTKDVLTTANILQPYYDKALNDPTTEQNDKEEIFLKQKRMKQLMPKYSSIKDAVSYNLGYIYAKKGDTERARKYLSEALETAPFSMKKDSLWMKTKTLLLSQYGLEGEF